MKCSANTRNLLVFETYTRIFSGLLLPTPFPDFPTYGNKGVQCKLSRNICCVFFLTTKSKNTAGTSTSHETLKKKVFLRLTLRRIYPRKQKREKGDREKTDHIGSIGKEIQLLFLLNFSIEVESLEKETLGSCGPDGPRSNINQN